jgi:phospholipid/cholesterol/gamma-HCH transport system substrate-binding protein
MRQTQKKRTIVVGMFIFLGIMILVAGILVLGGKENSFEKTVTLHAIFNDVSGLQKGNNVWFSGVKVGTVKRVKLISTTKVQVDVRIEEQSRDFIYRDAKVKVGSDGLIGNKILIIYGGTPGLLPVKADDTLQTEIPLNSAEMMSTLQESNKNLSTITSNFKLISGRLIEGQGTVGKLLTNDTLAMQMQATMAMLQIASKNIQMLSSNLATYTAKMQTKGVFANQLVTDTALFRTLSSAATQIQQASTNAKELTNNLKEVSYNLKDSSNVAGVLFHDQRSAAEIKTAIENIQSGTKKFDEDMEALQHNFLFRGFFRKRAKQQELQNKK